MIAASPCRPRPIDGGTSDYGSAVKTVESA